MDLQKLILILISLTLLISISGGLIKYAIENNSSTSFKTAFIETTPTPSPSPTSSPTPTPIQSGPTFTPSPTPTLKPTYTPIPKNEIRVKITYYGYPDNDPPGTNIAYPKSRYPQTIHEKAGGIGTFEDPITLASGKGVWNIGTKFYIPYIKKYAVLEDLCVGCGNLHIDLWMNSDGSHTTELLKCQNHFTKNSEIVEVNPPKGRTISTNPLFNTSTGECN